MKVALQTITSCLQLNIISFKLHWVYVQLACLLKLFTIFLSVLLARLVSAMTVLH